MKRLRLATSLLLFFSSLSFQLSAQSISGHVYSMDNEPIPYANLYIRELETGTTTDENGYFFLQFTVGGEYQVTISSLGYESLNKRIIINDEDLEQSFFLKSSSVALETVTVRASKRDPAYAIIQNAIDNKKKYLKAINSYKTTVYVKAVEEVDKRERNRRKRQQANNSTEPEVNTGSIFDEPTPQLSEAEKANQKLLNSLNMVEMQLTLNYEYPKKYKEERTAYKVYGNKNGLFIPKFAETDFNFYRNMVRLTGLADAPIISPLSNTSILSYKFKLVDTKAEGSVLVYKIKVIPRKSGNSTVSGYIYINDELWNINRVDFKFPKNGLKFFDALNLKQNYEALDDSLWIVGRQEFEYETKIGRFQTFRGNTTLKYSDFQRDYEFPAKFFKNEVVVTTKEAYKRDSSYWNKARPEKLSIEQQKVVFLRDSINTVINSKWYKDSVTAAYNKITFLELLWDGVGWRNHEKKSELFVGSIPSLIDYSVVGGFRAGPFGNYFRRFENGKMMRFSGRLSYGFVNEDLTGFFDAWHRYNPKKLGDISFRTSRQFRLVNSHDAFINQLSIANYLFNFETEVSHRIEIINGLYFHTNFSFNDRKSVEDYAGQTQLEDIITTNTNAVTDILVFDPYQAFITNTTLSYTPAQKYMSEPNRKIVLGSDYPTFTLRHRRGWENIFGSDVNFDYLEFSINQDVLLGQFGHLLYNAKIGNFVNTNHIQEVDLKRFRQSDPLWFSNPLHSFQILDTAINTTEMFFEFHALHHFNGAFVNNMPLIKKTGIRLVAGGGFMWLKDGNFRHQEIMAGFERVFKLGVRRRLKIGVFGIAADGNHTKPDTSFKISLDLIDTWRRDWSF